MADFLTFIGEHLTPLVANIGALAIIAWVFSIWGRNALTSSQGIPQIKPWLIGVGLGATASLLIFIPVELSPGIIGDGRGGPILLSGIIGGPVAAFITALMAGLTRFWIGGPGYLTGVAYVCLFALIGLAYWHLERRQDQPRLTLPRLFILATAATVISIPTVLLIPAEKQIAVLINLWPVLWVSNVIGTIILGTLLSRENERVKGEYELELQFKRAEQATVAKSRFVAAMSHEIRTPLNAVLGILQLVDNDQIPQDIRAKLKVAHNSGRFLLSLINQVLDFARIEANSIEPTKDPFTLSSMTDNICSIFNSQATAKGLNFECIVEDPKATPLIGSYAHIQQILFNFLGNAIKFTKDGSITLNAELIRSEDDVLSARFTVKDTGPGMSEEDVNVIFEEFQQAKVRPTDTVGTGLGLSISKALADAMNAEIGVETELGQGSTFFLVVPVQLGKQEGMALEGNVEDPAKGLNILVAEDNNINQMIVKAMLTHDQHSVTLAENGEKVIEAIRDTEKPFDLILMDIQMPVMDGIEATRRIRELESAKKDIPIIAVTANAFRDQRDSYLASGMNDVVIKPIDASKLQEAIKRVTSSP